MKMQVSRLSPHQNAKVFGVLMGITALVFVVPVFLIVLSMPSGWDAAWPALLLPLAYLVMSYVMIAIGCWLYNLMFKYIGGIEYETRGNEE